MALPGTNKQNFQGVSYQFLDKKKKINSKGKHLEGTSVLTGKSGKMEVFC